MNRILLDDEISKRLIGGGFRTEVCDSQGRVIGYFHSMASQTITPEMRQQASDQISDEEIERRLASKEGISTDELLRRLDAL